MKKNYNNDIENVDLENELDDFKSLKSKKNKKNNKQPVFPVVLATFIGTIIFVAIALIGYKYWNSMPQNQTVEYHEYFADDRQFVSVEDTYHKLETPVITQEGSVYVPFEFVKTYVDSYIFYDKDTSTITVTNTTNVIKMKTDDLTYYVNDDTLSLNLPIIESNDTAYLPIDIIENLYDVSIIYNEDNQMLSLNYDDLPSTKAALSSNTKLRYDSEKNSNIVDRLAKDETVEVYGEYDSFTKVKTSSGLLGYIPTKDLGTREDIESVQKDIYSPKNLLDNDFTLLWDQIYNYAANNLPSKQSLPTGVDVLSPTWFSFDENKLDGTIVSLADNGYVDAIHEQGGQVWPILTDNFNSNVSSSILRSAENRQNVIKQILALCTLYELDGINIDFEAVLPEDSEYFIQFLRELYPYMNKSGLILSVDTFVPSEWSMYYNRTAIGETVDYVVVMAYDEHTSASSTTGPVASLDFVDSAMANTLEEVPKNQVVMGMPFYTRIWKVHENGSFTISNYGMDSAIEFFERNNATFVDDPETGYTYAFFEEVENGVNYKFEAWLESSETIEKKLEIYEKYDVAGVALWSRGFEQDNTFETIHNVVN
ncbi:MAG: glycosyl hydrolase family 18 protein [Lachnospirales bacterium]